MPAQNYDKMTNSDEYDAQNEQNSTHFDANCTQKVVTDVLTHSIKPSEPSAISMLASKQNDKNDKNQKPHH
jgi:hypothetical protein